MAVVFTGRIAQAITAPRLRRVRTAYPTVPAYRRACCPIFMTAVVPANDTWALPTKSYRGDAIIENVHADLKVPQDWVSGQAGFTWLCDLVPYVRCRHVRCGFPGWEEGPMCRNHSGQDRPS